MADTWCTIESDPGVFTELIESIGVRGVQVEELYSLDEASFARLQPIYGLVFLFKWTGEVDNKRTPAEANDHPNLFFAQQVIPNACATQAILSVLLNSSDKVELGDTLESLKNFTSLFTPDMKGLAISNDEKVRAAHNSFARQEAFLPDEREYAGKDKDAFHFIAYLPHGGKVYELDGLRPGPIVLGEMEQEGDEGGFGATNWLDVATPAIQERIARYSSSEIRFNLMAIVRNRKLAAIENKDMHIRRTEAIDAALSVARGSGGSEAQGKDVDKALLGSSFVLAESVEDLEAQRAAEVAEVEECDATVREEEVKFSAWKVENVRRKHNYVPFAVNLMKILAEKGKLSLLVAKAKERTAGGVEPRAKPVE
ncbi:unnamed protein product [Choristocarpus tenellus]